MAEIPNNFIVTDVGYFVVTAIRADGKRVYFAWDHYHSGYPYWAEYISGSSSYSTLKLAQEELAKYHDRNWQKVMDTITPDKPPRVARLLIMEY